MDDQPLHRKPTCYLYPRVAFWCSWWCRVVRTGQWFPCCGLEWCCGWCSRSPPCNSPCPHLEARPHPVPRLSLRHGEAWLCSHLGLYIMEIRKIDAISDHMAATNLKHKWMIRHYYVNHVWAEHLTQFWQTWYWAIHKLCPIRHQ